MMLDDQLTVSRAQALTVTANSTDYIDMGANRSLGAGQEVIPFVDISAVGGTAPTLTVAFVGADDTGFSTNKITIDSVTPTLVSGTPFGFVRMSARVHLPKRYYRFEYTLGGTSPTMTITAGLCANEQTEITRSV